MRNPMLPLSPISNDGSARHMPTLAPASLDRCSRLNADPRDVRFSVDCWTASSDRCGRISVNPLSSNVQRKADPAVHAPSNFALKPLAISRSACNYQPNG